MQCLEHPDHVPTFLPGTITLLTIALPWTILNADISALEKKSLQELVHPIFKDSCISLHLRPQLQFTDYCLAVTCLSPTVPLSRTVCTAESLDPETQNPMLSFMNVEVFQSILPRRESLNELATKLLGLLQKSETWSRWMLILEYDSIRLFGESRKTLCQTLPVWKDHAEFGLWDNQEVGKLDPFWEPTLDVIPSLGTCGGTVINENQSSCSTMWTDLMLSWEELLSTGQTIAPSLEKPKEPPLKSGPRSYSLRRNILSRRYGKTRPPVKP